MTEFATSQEEFTRQEVKSALRNAGMPLEGLRYPITPIGMHFHLIHFDIPSIDPNTYELPIEGRVRRPLRLTLDDIKARPAVTMPVMMECAGIGAHTCLLAPYQRRGTMRPSGAPNGPAHRWLRSSRRLVCSTMRSRSSSAATIGGSTTMWSTTTSVVCRLRRLCARR